MPHFIPPELLNRRVEISLAGVGGNGSQMLTGLARLNHALTALGHPGLKSRSRPGHRERGEHGPRKLFGAFDVGASKAHVLVNRINAFFGRWRESRFGRYDRRRSARILIVCVDSARARHEIHRRLEIQGAYLMDLGNRASDGQVLFGEFKAARTDFTTAGDAAAAQPVRGPARAGRPARARGDTPSCGLAEALERQELFINQAVVTPALNILWEFFRHGRLTWHGAFVNLRTGSMRPLMVKEPAAPRHQRNRGNPMSIINWLKWQVAG